MDSDCEDLSGLEAEGNDTQNIELTFSSWDPMKEMYQRKVFNSYDEPTYDSDYHAVFSSMHGTDISPGKGDSDIIKLYVSNIPLSLTKEGLRTLFSKAGEVAYVKICNSKDPERGQTFGFVSYKSVRAATEAIRLFDKFEIGPKIKLLVRRAYTESERIYHKAKRTEEDQFYYDLYAGLDTEMKVNEEKSSIGQESENVIESSLVESPVKEGSSDGNETCDRNKAPCSVCAKPTTTRCKNCKTWYCSKLCQKKDWTNHKISCKGKRNVSPQVQNGDLLDDSKWMISINGYEEGEIEEPDLDEAPIKKHSFTAAPAAHGEQRLLRRTDLPKPCDVPDEFSFIFGDFLEGGIITGHPVLETETLALTNMTEEVTEYMTNQESTSSVHFEHGGLVLAQFMGEWGRAEMTSFDSGTQQVSITYIDYGNSDKVSIKDLKALPDIASSIPPMAQTFRLSQVSVIEDNVFESVCSAVKEKCADTVLLGSVVDRSGQAIEIVLKGEEDKETINDFVLSEIDKCTTTMADSKKVDKHPGAKDKMPSCDAGIVTTMLSDLPLQPLPSEDTFTVTLTEVVSPFHLYGWALTDDTVNRMAAVMDELDETYSLGDNDSFIPNVGEICVAYFPEDRLWYRANVLMFNSDQTVRVTYVDFGNTTDVEPSMIRRISKNLLQVPRQAIHFSLENPRIPETKLTDATAFIKRICLEHQCNVRVIARNSESTVIDLLCPNDQRSMIDVLYTEFGVQERSPPEEGKQVSLETEQRQLQDTDETSKLPNIGSLPSLVTLPNEFTLIVGDVLDESTICGTAVIEEQSLNLANLIKDLETYFNESPDYSLGEFQKGAIIGVNYMGEWSRGELLSYDERTDHVQIFYIDFGNTESRPLKEVMKLPSFALKLPPMAQRFQLKGIPEIEDANLREKARSVLKEKVTDQLLLASVCGKGSGGEVIIEVRREDEETTINELVLSVLGGKKGRVDESEAATVKRKQDTERTMLKDLPLVKSPEASTFSVTITEVVSPWCMYGWVIDEDTMESIAGLIDNLNSSYNIEYGEGYSPVVGEVVVALFPEDGSWYRGHVLRESGNGQWRVMYVDFGNEADIDVSMIRRIKKDLLLLPRQAKKFSFEDMEIPESKIASVTEFIKNSTADQQCMATSLRSKLDCIVIDLANPLDGKSMKDTLLDTFSNNSAADKKKLEIQTSDIKNYDQKNLDASASDTRGGLTHRLKDLPTPEPLPKEFHLIVGDAADQRTICGTAVIEEQSLNLANLIKDLETYFNENPDYSLREFQKGAIIGVNYMGEWSRGELLSYDERTDHVQIFYIDFGNTESRPLKEVMKLPSFALKLPPMAQRFQLKGIPEIEDANLREKAGSVLKEKVTDQLLLASVCGKGSGGEVIIEVRREDEETTINELVLSVLGGKKGRVDESEAATVKGTQDTQRTMLKDLPLVKSPEASTFSVTITEVVSPWCMYGWVIDEDTMESIAGLIDNVNSSYNIEDGEGYSPVVGEVVVALFPEDGSWYRGHVLRESGNGQWRVMYVDFGNEADIDVSMIRRIKKDLLRLPRQALKFSLANLGPKYDTDEVRKAIKEYTKEESLNASVTDRTDDALTVQIVIADNSCLNDIISDRFSKPEEEKGAMGADYVPATEASMSAIATTPNSGSFSKSPCGGPGKSFKPALLPMIEKLEIIVNNVVTPWRFFGILKDDTYASKIDKIQLEMSKLCPNALRCNDELTRGMAVCALSSDKQWYRGTVCKIGESDVVVAFLDYGTTESIPLENLRLPIEEVLMYPCQSFCFGLSDVKPLNERWDEDSCKRFRDTILNKECVLTVEVVKSLAVKGTLLVSGHEKSVSEMLVDENLAVFSRRGRDEQHANRDSNFGGRRDPAQSRFQGNERQFMKGNFNPRNRDRTEVSNFNDHTSDSKGRLNEARTNSHQWPSKNEPSRSEGNSRSSYSSSNFRKEGQTNESKQQGGHWPSPENQDGGQFSRFKDSTSNFRSGKERDMPRPSHWQSNDRDNRSNSHFSPSNEARGSFQRDRMSRHSPGETTRSSYPGSSRDGYAHHERRNRADRDSVSSGGSETDGKTRREQSSSRSGFPFIGRFGGAQTSLRKQEQEPSYKRTEPRSLLDPELQRQCESMVSSGNMSSTERGENYSERGRECSGGRGMHHSRRDRSFNNRGNRGDGFESQQDYHYGDNNQSGSWDGHGSRGNFVKMENQHDRSGQGGSHTRGGRSFSKPRGRGGKHFQNNRETRHDREDFKREEHGTTYGNDSGTYS